MVTLDTSVLADLFPPVEEGRKVKAKGIIEIEAYYLITEHDKVVERLREI
ncbi:MAG: hypothetical protein QMD80_08350 [archaeon]|nr:hypothetical protein [archaeon]